MSTAFVVLVAIALAGLAFTGYQYFHHKRLEQEEATKRKMQALMEAYRERRQSDKESTEEMPDLGELTAGIESLPVAPHPSRQWRRVWYTGLALVTVLAILWMAGVTKRGTGGQSLSQGLDQKPPGVEGHETDHRDVDEPNSHEKQPELELLEMSHSHGGHQVVINGLVRNVSRDTLKNIAAVIIFEDAEEHFLTSAQGRLVFALLLPGEESPFKIETADDHRMVGYQLNLRTHEGAPQLYSDTRKSTHDFINPPSKDLKHEDDEKEETHHEKTS